MKKDEENFQMIVNSQLFGSVEMRKVIKGEKENLVKVFNNDQH